MNVKCSPAVESAVITNSLAELGTFLAEPCNDFYSLFYFSKL